MKFRPMTPLGVLGALATLVVACEPGPSRSSPSHPTATRAAPLDDSPSSVAAAAGGFASALDRHGLPSFIWAVGAHPAEPADTALSAATRHLARFASAHGLRASDLDTAELELARDLGAGGHLVKWRQRAGGVEVYPSKVAVLMRPNLELVAISGHLQALRYSKGTAAFERSPADALASVLGDLLETPVSATDVIDLSETRGDFQRFKVASHVAVSLPEPAHVKRIFWAGGVGLEPAHFVELYAGAPDSTDSEAFRYILSARDGRVLDKRSLTATDAFGYRVWAETTGVFRPFDSPLEDFTPHPIGTPGSFTPGLTAPSYVEVEGFNNGPGGLADPWLAAEAVQTRGNNVDAYSDDNAPDGYSNGDLRAITTSPQVFDRTFDFNTDAAASDDQIMASVTELFYVNNWLHDWWYNSGFDEAAGNAQLDNFGRGGVGGDPLNAQAQDNRAGGARNNANMSTPSDGLSPRMQMYQWTGPEESSVTLTPGGTLVVGTAAFGPTTFDVTGEVVAMNDGTGNPNDGCTPPVVDVTGRIVLVDRGACTFVLKAQNIQNAGGIGMILANNAASATPPGMGGVDPTITIGVLSVLQSDGAAIRANLLAGPVTASLHRFVGLDRDGSLDHQIVAHEWGHYLHHRLADCGSQQCRSMSEGWADWVSLYMGFRPGDRLDGVYATGTYGTLSFGDAAYFGIRRTPYSTNRAANDLSFRHIQDGEPAPSSPFEGGGVNSEVHNSGEVWSTMMWDAYMSLMGQVDGSTNTPSFDEVQRRMADYVVAGLQMTPLDATFTEQRDAILAAAAARSTTDLNLLVAAFAGRGAGSCAVSPPRDSFDHVGVVESNSVQPRVVLGAVQLDQSARDCDGDGVFDAEESGRILVDVSNPSPVTLADLTLTLTASEAGVLFPAGATIQVPEIAPFGSTTVELAVGLDGSLTGVSTLTIGVQASSAEACEGTTTSTVVSRVNLDVTAGSTIDEVESPITTWGLTGTDAETIWSRAEVEPLAYAWVGVDFGSTSDTRLESPSLTVSSTGSFVLSFDHRYSFEADSIFWDGGVIEVSTDDGASWVDISTYVDPGYGGQLTDISGNPLALRMAYVATSSAWPNRHHVDLDLGGALAGTTAKVRFRIGSDAGVGAFGWEIDNIRVSGIDNAPFTQIVEDSTLCAPLLAANAGADLTVSPRDVVVLDGASSTSANALPLTYGWAQVSGPTVSLSGSDTARPYFSAPEQGVAVSLVFELTVSDGTLVATDQVTVEVTESGPLVAHAGDDQTVDARAVVVLEATAESPTALPLTYVWTQTAGPAVTLSAGAGAVVRFEAPAAIADTTYSFEVTVSDGGRVATDSVDVVVRAVGALAANAGGDQTVDVGAVVILDGSASASASGLPLTFAWSQTGGAPVSLQSADRAVARFEAIAAAAGSTVELTLTVSDGVRTAVDTVEITVNAEAVITLTANAGPDRDVDAGATVVLDGTMSESSANLPLTFSWAQLAGPNVALSNPRGAATTFTAPSGAEEVTLELQLTVTDGTRTEVDTVSITVAPAPVAELTAEAGADRTVDAGAVVVLDGTGSTSSDNLALTYSWSQTSGPLVTLSNASGPATTFNAPSIEGQMSVLVFGLTVGDGTSEKTDTVTITVRPAVPATTEEDSCGCTTTESRTNTGTRSLLALAGLALFFGRRRSRRA